MMLRELSALFGKDVGDAIWLGELLLFSKGARVDILLSELLIALGNTHWGCTTIQ